MYSNQAKRLGLPIIMYHNRSSILCDPDRALGGHLSITRYWLPDHLSEQICLITRREAPTQATKELYPWR